MKIIALVFYLTLLSLNASGQVLHSKRGYVKFFSSAPIEDISAENKKPTATFNTETGEAVFLIPISGFEFRKSLMKTHFNENYMESDTYPEAFFQGKITGYNPGETENQALAVGDLTIHGVKRQVNIPGKITNTDGKAKFESVFMVVLDDHKIEIPKLMFQKIAEKVEVTVRFEFERE